MSIGATGNDVIEIFNDEDAIIKFYNNYSAEIINKKDGIINYAIIVDMNVDLDNFKDKLISIVEKDNIDDFSFNSIDLTVFL